MRKRRPLPFGPYESLLHRLRWRFRDNGLDGLGGGNAGGGTPVEEPDVPPVNGGPDRDYDSLSSGVVDDSQPDPGSAGNPGQNPLPADPNQRAGVAAGQQTSEAQWQSIREAAEAQGFRFDATVTDDRTALNFLLRQASAPRQANIYEQLGRQLAPKANDIQQYLAGQQKPQATERKPWEAPEFDERWSALVERDDATGLFVAKQGVPHEIATKVNQFVEWKRNYDRNPAAVINGMVEARAKEVAAATFREQFEAQRREATITEIVRENGAWMYQVDANGQRLRDYQGQYIPTPVGAAYLQQVQAVQRMGVTDPRQQDALAKQLVRGQYALAAQQQALAAQQQGTNVQTQQAVTRPNVNPLQAQPPSQRRRNPAATEPEEAGLSLMDRMRRDLAAEGVTDVDIQRSAEQ